MRKVIQRQQVTLNHHNTLLRSIRHNSTLVQNMRRHNIHSHNMLLNRCNARKICYSHAVQPFNQCLAVNTVLMVRPAMHLPAIQYLLIVRLSTNRKMKSKGELLTKCTSFNHLLKWYIQNKKY